MKIGDSIVVKLKGQKAFRSKIIDINQTLIWISYPKEWKFTGLKAQKTCTVYYADNNLPHMFETTIENYIDENIPVLVINYPEKEQVEKIQRREFVRIQTDVDIAIYFPGTNIQPVVTVSQDISGGGIRAVLPKELLLENKQLVNLFFVLKSRQNNFEYVYTKAEVVNTHLEDGVHSVSLRFLLDSEKERQRIISYCFDIQREKRKQGLE